MKVLVAGSRGLDKNKNDILFLLDHFQHQLLRSAPIEFSGNTWACVVGKNYQIQKWTSIISGGAVGPDKIGEEWARLNKVDILQSLPDWKKYGRSAGIRRNADLVNAADIAFIFWDGVSPGTKNTIDRLKISLIPWAVICPTLSQENLQVILG